MSNLYKELKNKHQQEVNNFPFMFAFDNKQFAEGMKKLGLTENDTDKIYSIGSGGYIRKTDSKALDEMTSKHEKEMQEAINNDITGDGFIYDMFVYELNNHEYGYTCETYDTLQALNLTIEEINSNANLLHGFNKAKKYIMNLE